MGTLKGLSQPDCGQPNALVRFAGAVTEETRTTDVFRGFGETSHGRMVNEYLEEYRSAAPSTFSMTEMLREVNGVRDDSTTWTDEYLSAHKSIAHAHVAPANLESAWGHASGQPIQHVPQPTGETRWASDYLAHFDQSLAVPLPPSIGGQSEQWASELLDHKLNEHLEHAWTDARQAEPKSDLTEAWADSLASSSTGEKWVNDFMAYQAVTQEQNNKYEFREENPWEDTQNPLEEGKKRLAEGDLANAVLLFEVAVKREEDNSEAWQYLGHAQAENEQELLAIAALTKSTQLDPNNAEAQLALAVSLTNETKLGDACDALRAWVRARYGADAPSTSGDPPPEHIAFRMSSFLHPDEFKNMESLLHSVANRSGSVQPDIQNALGVFYNMGGEYEKAVECFQTALHLDPQNARLWNRLGATLANGDRSAEAVAAYDRALRLYPGFVRSRYNLGIACVNLQAHEQAIGHFLSALALQQRGIGPNGAEMSDNVWNSLRFSIRQSNDLDSLRMAEQKNLQGLLSKFGVKV